MSAYLPAGGTMPGVSVSRREHEVLTYVLAYTVHAGVAPTRATCDRAGYGDMIGALARRGLVQEPSRGLGRVTVTAAGRAAAMDTL